MVSDDALACVGIGMAVLCWGSYMAPVKSRAVVAVGLDALVFQLYMSLGIALSSQALFLLPFVTPAWTSWALVAAVLWVPASLLCIPCVRLVGIALGQGVWAGAVALVSFVWGLSFGAGMSEPALGSLGLLMLIAGIAGISVVAGGGQSKGGERDASALTEQALAAVQGALDDRLGLSEGEGSRKGEGWNQGEGEGDCEGACGEKGAPVIVAEEQNAWQLQQASQREELRRRRFGIGLALVIGLFAGSTMVPIRFAPKDPFRDGLRAISFACCFGPSVLLVTIALFPPYALVRRRCGLRPAIPPFHARTCLLPGIASGVLWNIGNVGAVLAVLPEWGLTVGFPSTQDRLFLRSFLSRLANPLWLPRVEPRGALLSCP